MTVVDHGGSGWRRDGVREREREKEDSRGDEEKRLGFRRGKRSGFASRCRPPSSVVTGPASHQRRPYHHQQPIIASL